MLVELAFLIRWWRQMYAATQRRSKDVDWMTCIFEFLFFEIRYRWSVYYLFKCSLLLNNILKMNILTVYIFGRGGASRLQSKTIAMKHLLLSDYSNGAKFWQNERHYLKMKVYQGRVQMINFNSYVHSTDTL